MHTRKAITGARRKREAERNRRRNLPVRTRVRGKIREALAAIESSGETAHQSTLAALREIDRGQTKGILHRRAAARKKSRLMRRLGALAPGSQQAD